ncbi:VWA domain-containing protein [Mycobacterium sp. NPDC006124]|uniref:VWA domain-containing protein n=1 Tax=Mycobacterium sp. NPDC006124 TaxID=3156729 RepID=UPI00339ED6CA
MSSVEQQGNSGFSVDVDHNPYLPEGSGTVDAIVSITVGSDVAVAATPAERIEAIIVDCSTSMLKPAGKFDGAKQATVAAVDELSDGTHFVVVCGTASAEAIYPPDGMPVRASAATKAEAARAVNGLIPYGGTAMGTWLAFVRDVVGRFPGASSMMTHAILLTDGKDEHETPEQLQQEIALSVGKFTCDCRGVGTAWRVDELRSISSALMGTVDIVADADDLAEDFAAMMRTSMGKSIPDLTLRVWTPAGATVEFVKQVAPTVADLTARRVDVSAQIGEYPLGSWGAEDRDYHVQVAVEPAAAGKEKLAARVTVVAGEQVLGQGLVNALWTADTALSARINRRVAHYTGQAELADAVQQGLAARRDGDVATATAKLQRAMELAVESGNDDKVAELGKVIDVDERTGTARLKREVAAADEMALDARSTKTARVRKEKPA